MAVQISTKVASGLIPTQSLTVVVLDEANFEQWGITPTEEFGAVRAEHGAVYLRDSGLNQSGLVVIPSGNGYSFSTLVGWTRVVDARSERHLFELEIF
jgi:hypothetical protein